MFESAASIHPILTTRNLTAHPIVGGNHDSIKGSMTHLGEGVEITDFPGEREGWGEGEKQTKSKTLLHTKFVFRCVLASLYEGLSVRPWVRPSVGPSVSIKEVRARTHLMAVYPALFKDENRWRWPVTLQLAYRSNKKLIQRKPVWKALIVFFYPRKDCVVPWGKYAASKKPKRDKIIPKRTGVSVK